MSKQAYSDVPDEELPPSYSEAVTPSLTASSLPSLFSGHLRNLPSQINTAQAARTSARDQNDSEVLGLLVPHIDDLLSSIAAMDPPPKLVEMTLVPEEAVGYEWQYSDKDKTQTLIRVRTLNFESDEKKPKAPVQVPGHERAFDDWGRWKDESGSSSRQESYLWWSDEDMANRLAKYLQPKRVDRQMVKVQMQKVKEVKKSNRWSLFKKPETPPPQVTTNRVLEEEEDATMTVKAEEVTFRRANDFGLYESKTGWGIVVRVRIRS